MALIQDVKYSDYQSSKEGIGHHLDRAIGLTGKGKERRVFADESGTIRDKVKFCRMAVQHMQDKNFDWQLTPELTSLCQRIYAHILKHNQN